MPPHVDRKCARGPAAPIGLAGDPAHGSRWFMDPRRRLTTNSVATAFSLLKKTVCATTDRGGSALQVPRER